MRKVLFLCTLLAMTTLGSFAWHALTLAYAHFLGGAVPMSNAPYTATMRPFTDVFGYSFMVPGNVTLEPSDYQRFVDFAGRGSWCGLGTLKGRQTLEHTSAFMWVLRMGLMMAAVQFLAAAAITCAVMLAGRASKARMIETLGRASPAGWCIALLMPVLCAVCWYIWLPRSQLDSALFRAHESGVLILLVLAGVAGFIQGSIDAWSAQVHTHHVRCPRCGYPRTGLPIHSGLCTDCGWVATPASIGKMHLRRVVSAVAAIVLLIAAAAFLWSQAGPRGTGFWHRDRLVWWMAMRPMERN